MVNYRLIYENQDKTIKLTKMEEKEVSIYGTDNLPPKMIQIELDNNTVELYLVEVQVMPK